jgi:formate/nitrite transporter FocA (FNT family)
MCLNVIVVWGCALFTTDMHYSTMTVTESLVSRHELAPIYSVLGLSLPEDERL